MGKHVECEAVLPMHPAEYWVVRHTPAFLELECKYLKNAAKMLVKETLNEDGALVTQQLATKPDLSLVPEFVLKMGPEEGIVFMDYLEYRMDHPDTPYFHTIRTQPSFMADKCSILGELKLFPSQDGRSCRQVLSVHVSVNIFAVGVVVEQVVATGLRNAYALLPQIVQEWKEQSMKVSSWSVPASWEDTTWDCDSLVADMDDENEIVEKFYDALPSMEPTCDIEDSDDISHGSASTQSMSVYSKPGQTDTADGGKVAGARSKDYQPIPTLITAQPDTLLGKAGVVVVGSPVAHCNEPDPLMCGLRVFI